MRAACLQRVLAAILCGVEQSDMTRTVLTLVMASAALAPLAVAGRQPQQPADHPRFRVAVDAVRIDAVVTDRDGRIVSDLTADDFEVLQDGKRQRVTFAQFVPVLSSPVSPASAPSPRRSTGPVPPPASPAPVTRASIQRTFAIVVDDLGLSVESFYYLKRGLHDFIDRDLQPTDLVGIMRTGGTTAVQPFTTDRRILHAAVDALRWNGFTRTGVEAFAPVNKSTTFDNRHGLGDQNDFKLVDTLRHSMLASGTLGALNLAVRGARDLPGRKSLMFVSEGFLLYDQDGPDSRVRLALDRVIDQATRAGVVIYSMDPRGLQTGGLQASDNLSSADPGVTTMDKVVRGEAAERSAFNRDTQEALRYVAEQTGGFAVLNTNDLSRGLGRITADVRDYYVIGYLPEEGTFVGKGKKPSYHKISVTVRRPGLRVRTRKEFLGVVDVDESSAPLTPAQELIHAAIAPFTATDMALRATTLPGYEPNRGLFVRTLLHIDARALAFVDTEDQKKTASADVLGMVFDRDGTEVAHLSTGFSVGLTDRATEEALQAGLVYTLHVPIPRAGAYQLRFAVRDQKTGKLGSAGEFVELPDVERGAFALSGIVLRSEGSAAPGDAAGGIQVSPAQAIGVYRPGDEISYAYEIYNAAKQVQASATVWRGAENVAALPADPLARPAGGERRFAAAGRLKLGEGLPPGNYVLQISATTADSPGERSRRTAAQRISFDVR